MKYLSSIISYLLLIVFSISATAADWKENEKIGDIFENAGVTGTFVLYDVAKDEYTGFNKTRAETRYIPASTFKIANSLIGLTVGAVENVDEILPYGGGDHFMDAWEKDMSLRDAIKISNVPIYQELARRIGLDQMQENVIKLGYGNKDIGPVVDRFWLDGPLKISAVEQTKFVAKLAEQKLNFPVDVQQSVIDIIEIEKTDDWTLYAKTGWQTATDPGIGWWVGFVRKDDKIYSFAINIDMNDIADAPKRIEIGKTALMLLGVL